MKINKFRAWFKGCEPLFEGDWLYDSQLPQMLYNVQKLYDGKGPDDKFKVLGGYGSFGQLLDNEDFIIMQFTGLYDKNGKEIYEGDIIKDIGNFKKEPKIRQVVYVTEIAGFALHEKDDFLNYSFNADIEKKCYHLEIIGNVFEPLIK